MAAVIRMMMQLHKKHIILLLCSIVFFCLLYLGGYFLFLKPIKESIRQIDHSNGLMQKQLDKTTATNDKQEPILNSYSLQKKIPVTPLVEQFVLDVEKAEIASNSTIQSIEFTKGGMVIPIEDKQEEQETQMEAEALEDEQQTTQSELEIPGIPEGLEQLLVKLTVKSDNYYDLKKFVETIEQQQRITLVKQLSFQGPSEVTENDQIINPLVYELQLTTFYMPSLTDLSGETPTINTPLPSNKHNPLFPYMNDGNDE